MFKRHDKPPIICTWVRQHPVRRFYHIETNKPSTQERRGKLDVKIVRVDDRSLMQIGETQIEVADYNIKSSADGSTELSVTIKENAPTFELSASLESPKKQC
nr:MAG TPA: hypothetical protein [Caudoviricetes sp.]